MKILIVLFIGIAVYFLLKGLNIVKRYLINQRVKWIQKFNFIPAIEFVSWLVFIYWAIEYLFQDKMFYQYLVISIVIIVVGFLAWFVVRDFIAGIIFKAQNNLQVNKMIQLGEVRGRIIAQKSTHLTIETTGGQIIKIPYSKLNQEIISEISDSTINEEFKFQFQTKKTKGKQETEEEIKYLLINSPWINFNITPILKLISEDNTFYTFEVTAGTLNHKHMWLLEKSIRKQLSDY
jgi:hypothetical protein